MFVVMNVCSYELFFAALFSVISPALIDSEGIVEGESLVIRGHQDYPGVFVG